MCTNSPPGMGPLLSPRPAGACASGPGGEKPRVGSASPRADAGGGASAASGGKMNYMPGTASLIQDIDSELRAGRPASAWGPFAPGSLLARRSFFSSSRVLTIFLFHVSPLDKFLCFRKWHCTNLSAAALHGSSRLGSGHECLGEKGETPPPPPFPKRGAWSAALWPTAV